MCVMGYAVRCVAGLRCSVVWCGPAWRQPPATSVTPSCVSPERESRRPAGTTDAAAAAGARGDAATQISATATTYATISQYLLF